MGKKRPTKRNDDKGAGRKNNGRQSPPLVKNLNDNIVYEDAPVKMTPEPEATPEIGSPDEAGQDDNPPVTVEPPSDSTFRKRKSVSEILSEQTDDEELELEGKRRRLLASAWHARDGVYRKLFGQPAYVTPANYGPPSETVPHDFKERQSRRESGADTSLPEDPTLDEQHLAVLAYGPDPLSPCWKYVTAGLASPWLQYEPLDVSGFGCEIMVKSPVDLPWAAQFLRTLAFYVFNHAGLLSQGVRLALNSPIDPNSKSELRNAFIWYADEAPDTLYELPSGWFGIVIAVGITDDELKFADSIEEYGTWCIQAALRQAGYGQITDPQRSSIMQHERIDSILSNVRTFCETFRANRAGAYTADDTMS